MSTHFPIKSLLTLINQAKTELKSDPIMIELCQEYDQEVDIIDFFPTKFEVLEVSANTNHGIVTLNSKLLEEGDLTKIKSYMIHEYNHVLQQCFGTEPTQSSDDGNYLDNPFEEEAFSNQIAFIADQKGKDQAEDYVDDLLDHHDVTDQQEIEEKKEVLLEKVD